LIYIVYTELISVSRLLWFYSLSWNQGELGRLPSPFPGKHGGSLLPHTHTQTHRHTDTQIHTHRPEEGSLWSMPVPTPAGSSWFLPLGPLLTLRRSCHCGQCSDSWGLHNYLDSFFLFQSHFKFSFPFLLFSFSVPPFLLPSFSLTPLPPSLRSLFGSLAPLPLWNLSPGLRQSSCLCLLRCWTQVWPPGRWLWLSTSHITV
jgi:hypothetical protein